MKKNNILNIKKFFTYIQKHFFLQIAVVFSFIVLLIVSSITVILIFGIKNRIINNYKIFVRNCVRQVTVNANYFIVIQDKKIRLLKNFLELSGFSTLKENLLIGATLDDNSITYVSLIDIDGNEILCSEPVKKLKNCKEKKFFKKAVSGEKYVSKVIINENHFPIIREALPITNGGKVNYVLYAEIDLSGIWKYLDQISAANPGYFFLISDNGVLCSFKERKFVMQNEDVNTRLIIENSLKSLRNVTILELSSGKKYLVACEKIKHLPFYLAYRMDVSIVIKELKRITFFILGVSFLFFLIGLVLIFWLINRFSQPILKLSDMMSIVGYKHFPGKQKLLRRGDEVGILYRKFYEMNEKLLEAKARERLAVIGESAMGISHEIKNPLTAIKNYISLLIEYPDDKEIFEKFSNAVPQEIERIQNMLEDLSNLSLGKKLNLSVCDIKSIIEQCILLFEKEFEMNKIFVSFECKADSCKVPGDKEKLKSVFINLMKNSIEALENKKNDKKINIELFNTECKNQKYLKIIFKDNGCGMSRYVLRNLFQPFFTTKKKGLGIGLAVVKGIIEQHQGFIEVFSDGLKKGTIFVIYLRIN